MIYYYEFLEKFRRLDTLVTDQSFSKYIENKCNFFNDIFRNFEIGVYFALPLYGVEENTISDFNSKTDSVKSK